MFTNDLKKGARVQLRATGFSGPVGWYATIADNMKGTIRMAEVEGLYKEIGSVYAHDIMRALLAKGRGWLWLEAFGVKGPPVVFKTKRALFAAFSAFDSILCDKAAGRL